MTVLSLGKEKLELYRELVNNKVITIGIDGATFRIIDSLMLDGELPTLRRLIEDGTRGALQSTLHPLSPPAWASFMTGMNPGKHGIFDFIVRDPKTYELRPVNGSYLKAPTLWSRLSEAGKRVGVINVPMTYPPEEVNGFLISGMDSPRLERAYSFPPSLSKELDDPCGGYLLDCSTKGPRDLNSEQMTSLYTQSLVRLIRKRGSVARYLREKYDPDFFIVVFIASDRIQHAAGEAIESLEKGRSSRFAPYIREVYKSIDSEIGLLLEGMDESWTAIIVSDHGADPYSQVFNLVYWLAENQFLYLSGRQSLGSLVHGLQRAKHKLLYTLGLDSRQGKKRISPLLHMIDWERTKAYAFGAFGSIFINLRGREPLGAVEPGREYDDLCAEIAERLLGAKDPITGARLVESVHRGADVYMGEYVSAAPDLLITPSKDYHVRNSLDDFEWSLTYPAAGYGGRSTLHTGKHSLEGVFIASGPPIRRGCEIQEARILDVAPTILYLLGVPISYTMDGRVLERAIDPDYLSHNPVMFGEDQTTETPGPHRGSYSESEEREINERLRELGYLG